MQAFGSARVKRRNSFSGSEFSGSYQYDRDQSCGKGGWGEQSSSFDQDVSGYLSAVLSRVKASDFPKLDFESEQYWEGAAESWMQLMGPKLSAVCREVAEFWELNEREGPRKVRNVLAHPPMARRRVQASAMLELRSQPIERRFRPVVLDAVLEGDTETDHECLFVGSCSADMLSMCGMYLAPVQTESRPCCESNVQLA